MGIILIRSLLDQRPFFVGIVSGCENKKKIEINALQHIVTWVNTTRYSSIQIIEQYNDTES